MFVLHLDLDCLENPAATLIMYNNVILHKFSGVQIRKYLGITVHYVESGKLKNVVLGVPRFKGKLGSFSWAVIKLVLSQTANIDLVSDTPIDWGLLK